MVYRSISHRFRSAPDVPDGRTDGQADGIGLAIGGTMHYSTPAAKNDDEAATRRLHLILFCMLDC